MASAAATAAVALATSSSEASLVITSKAGVRVFLLLTPLVITLILTWLFPPVSRLILVSPTLVAICRLAPLVIVVFSPRISIRCRLRLSGFCWLCWLERLNRLHWLLVVVVASRLDVLAQVVHELAAREVVRWLRRGSRLRSRSRLFSDDSGLGVDWVVRLVVAEQRSHDAQVAGVWGSGLPAPEACADLHGLVVDFALEDAGVAQVHLERLGVPGPVARGLVLDLHVESHVERSICI